MRGLFITICFMALSLQARADLLFEGFSKVTLAGNHIGFVIQRYEFDPKKQEFSTTYMLKTNETGGNITESLKARAGATLKPISFQYTELSGNKARTIDATFKGEQMDAIIKNGSTQHTISKKIPKGAFLSSFLVYLMLQGKEGIKPGVKYGYQAIAEEDGNVYAGEAAITAEEQISGISAFKVLNTFKGSQFISYTTHKGEIVSTRSPIQQISTELVPTLDEATAGQAFNAGTVKLLFGSMPKGTENSVARRTNMNTGTNLNAGGTASDKPTHKPTPLPPATKQKILQQPPPTESAETRPEPKKQGVPQGQGIQIKSSPQEQ